VWWSVVKDLFRRCALARNWLCRAGLMLLTLGASTTALLAGADRQETTAAAAPTTRESEAQTIARCREDLRSTDADARRRAVLILGKYTAPEAVTAVVGSLNDPAATVRQTALVSLAERDMIPADAILPIISLLTDASLEVRRIAAAVVADMYKGFGRMYLHDIEQQAAARAQIAAAVNAALTDADVVVRKTIFELHNNLRNYLQPEIIVGLLTDDDAQIRSLAVIAIRTMLPPNRQQQLLQPLLHDPVTAVRQEIVQTLSRQRPAPIPMLAVLAEDPDLHVRTRAIQELLTLQNAEALPLAIALIADAGIPVALRRQLLPHLPNYGNAGKAVILELVDDPSHDLAVTALEVLARQWGEALTLPFLLQCQQRPQQRMRMAVQFLIIHRGRELDAAQLQALLQSRYADVRALTLAVAERLPEPQAQRIANELLLDDDRNVHLQAVQLFAARSLLNWQSVLARSLRHPESQTNRAAAGALLRRNDAESIQILKAFLPECTDAELARFIAAAIQARENHQRWPQPQ